MVAVLMCAMRSGRTTSAWGAAPKHATATVPTQAMVAASTHDDGAGLVRDDIDIELDAASTRATVVDGMRT